MNNIHHFLWMTTLLLTMPSYGIAGGGSMTTSVTPLQKPAFAWSGEMRHLAVSFGDGVRVFDVATGMWSDLRIPLLSGSPVRDLALSSDGSVLLGVQCRAAPDRCIVEDMSRNGHAFSVGEVNRNTDVRWLRMGADDRIAVLAFNDEINAFGHTSKGWLPAGRLGRNEGYGDVVVMRDNVVTLQNDGLRFLKVGQKGLAEAGLEAMKANSIGACGDTLWIVADGHSRLILRRATDTGWKTIADLPGTALSRVAVSNDAKTLWYGTVESGKRVYKSYDLTARTPIQTLQVQGLPDNPDVFAASDKRMFTTGVNRPDGFVLYHVDASGSVQSQTISYPAP